MANLLTYSKFYYNFIVDENNNYIDFDDGSGEKSAEIPFGSYTLNSLAQEISGQMTSLSSSHIFDCTVNRDTRIFTISASSGGNFSLLFDTGTHASLSISSLIKFNASDYTLSSSYDGYDSTGSVFYPQYLLQNYVDADYTKFPISSVVNRSTSGNNYEVVRFGSSKLYRFEIQYTTNLDLEKGSIIKNNPTGLEDLNYFMDYITNKYPIEFMKDENDSNTFDTIVLESSSQSEDGVSYEIIPSYDKNLPEFYSLGGPLVFRRVE